MSSLNTFFGGSSAPVGTLVQAAYSLNDPAYLLANGAKILRSAYPLFSATQPSVNTFTYTARTKGVATGSSAIAVHAGLWVIAGATGANNIQTTPDGITFTQRVTPSAITGCDVRSLISDGTNVVGVAVSSVGSDAFYSADGITYTKTASTVSCSSNSRQSVMAYAPTLGTSGRFIVAGGGASFFISDDRGVTWTTQAHGLGAGVFNVVWTGSKFIALPGTSNTIYTSATGLAGSWVSQTIFNISISGNSISSDGSGRVLVANSRTLSFSTDHGVTWSDRSFVDPTSSSTVRVGFIETSFANGLFFATTSSATQSSTSPGLVVVSKDLISFSVLPDLFSLRFDPNNLAAFSYKSGVYFVTCSTSATVTTSAAAITFVEDATKMYLPLAGQAVPAATAAAADNAAGFSNTVTYVKVT